ncbi:MULTISPECIES: fumarate hydratase [Dictyoglomus]|jgi:fumarate hydratase subunit alpha|uniref:Hydro-lyase, Fe-S type, tartrate/fumarate subfamily, alpha subunit n=1 Tax=Dictyoglomus turgidum (strain DSM 6724 / Z-1310) TaxID=515635 RepID=B8E0H0_DICTD|nr:MULTISPECIES: fumarate hydratase [Dictyoglomus]ACK42615.1 hydro-lyase, Fe-S type, tartrate/fumarate subfamily, alpha subunit [Dictyoglomus turgidum DSM 6724]PNV80497.1 MAG: fumarate hydratase [Dictyoglomus turgidum]HBU31158.1 fumarate hydratase [Dictyoglomus sp.]
MFRVINQEEIYKKLVDLIEKVNFSLPEDVEKALLESRKKEEDKNAQIVLDILIENAKIAKEKKIPVCQDCGMVVAFVEIGRNLCINGNIENAINDAVRTVYVNDFLRKSVVRDPLRRINTEDNTPAVIHYDVVDGDKLRINILIKGFGSENASVVKNLLPTVSREELINEIIEHIKLFGPNACPPLIVGIGIGGTLEKAAILSKKALLRPIGKHNDDPFWASLEDELLEKINNLNIGPGGLGGKTTALAVNIESYPVHIAGFTLAINLQCCAVRHGWVEI